MRELAEDVGRRAKRRRSACRRTRRSSSAGSAPARAWPRARPSRPSSTRGRCTSSTQEQATASMAPRKETKREATTGSAALHSLRRWRSRRRRTERPARRRRPRRRRGPRRSRARSASTGSGPAPRRPPSAGVIKAFNKVYPNVKVNYKPVGNNVPTVLATAIAGGHPPDMADIAQPGLVKQLAQQGHLKPITYAKSVISAELRAGVVAARHVRRQAVRARLQGGQQVAALVQRARFQGRGRDGAEDVGAAADRREDAPGVGHAGLLDRRLGRLDAHRPVREHLPAHVRAGEVRRPARRTRSSGPTRR